MITFITHLRVSPQNARAFEAAVAEMTRKVRENEPGVAYYALSRSGDDPQTYAVIEVYRDEAALEAHQRTDYFAPSLAQTTQLVEAGAFDIKRYVSP